MKTSGSLGSWARPGSLKLGAPRSVEAGCAQVESMSILK
jgi:hypothetical protein